MGATSGDREVDGGERVREERRKRRSFYFLNFFFNGGAPQATEKWMAERG